MSTPARPDGRRTHGREVLRRAAVRCMVERGYFGTSIREIAEAAGMTSAALYHHFASKQAILVEIMDRALDESYRMTMEAARFGPDPSAQLRLMVHAWVLFHCLQRDEAMIGASELRSLDDEARRHVVSRRDRQETAFRAVVQAGISDGEFHVTDPLVATRAIITMGTSVATWFDPSGAQSADQIAEQYADLALNMVTGCDGQPRR